MEDFIKELIEEYKDTKDLTKVDKKFLKKLCDRYENKYNNNKYQYTGEIPVGLDWSGAELNRWNLNRLILSKFKNSANFENVSLEGADLKETSLISAKLENAKMKYAKLKKAKLSKAILKNANLMAADLENADLSNTYLGGANLSGANLENTWLSYANLNRAFLGFREPEWFDLLDREYSTTDSQNRTNLKDSDLTCANLDNANLIGAYLEGANLNKANFEKTNIIYAPYFEKVNESNYKDAEDTYRRLKNLFKKEGYYDRSGLFYYQERVAERRMYYESKKYFKDEYKYIGKRKKTINNLKFFLKWIFNLTQSALCGYGEKPYRVILSSLFIIFLFGTIFMIFNGITTDTNYNIQWYDNYYFSVITFTTLGFGDIHPSPEPIFKLCAMIEAFTGAFMIALFVLTFGRKMLR